MPISDATPEATLSTLPTFTLEAIVAGGANTFLMGLLNGAGSGKILKLWRVVVNCPDVSGTDVVIDYELRKITALTAGSVVTPARMRSSFGASVATARSLPTGATDIAGENPLVMQFMQQLNQATAPASNFIPLQAALPCDPLVLEDGQGCVVKQIDVNASVVRVGMVYTEEDAP